MAWNRASRLLVEEAEDLATGVLAARLLVVHDAERGRQDDVSELFSFETGRTHRRPTSQNGGNLDKYDKKNMNGTWSARRNVRMVGLSAGFYSEITEKTLYVVALLKLSDKYVSLMWISVSL